MQELDQALDDLRSGKPERQAAAHEVLLRLADEPERRGELVARLGPLVDERDPQARGTAVIVLALARDEDVLRRLEANVGDPDPGFRCDLAHAASVVGPEGRELLRRMLEDPVFEVRFEAAVGLAEQGDAAAVPVLLEALEIGATRLQAFSSLQLVADERAREPVRRWFRRFFASGFERVAAAGVLVRLGDAEARALIVERIGRRRGDERGLAIAIAGELRLQEAGEPLRRVLANRQDPFRGAAARSLGMLGEPGAVALLEPLLLDESEEEDVRLDAADGLMHHGSEESRRALERALGSVGSAEVREAVREALAAHRPEGTLR